MPVCRDNYVVYITVLQFGVITNSTRGYYAKLQASE